jgi:hypothetical protein
MHEDIGIGQFLRELIAVSKVLLELNAAGPEPRCLLHQPRPLRTIAGDHQMPLRVLCPADAGISSPAV